MFRKKAINSVMADILQTPNSGSDPRTPLLSALQKFLFLYFRHKSDWEIEPEHFCGLVSYY